MQQSITDRSLAHLKPQAKRYEVRDKLLPGFGVRISPKNQKSFFVVTRIGTRQRRVSIGHYPLVTLSSARQKALEVMRDCPEPAVRANAYQQLVKMGIAQC